MFERRLKIFLILLSLVSFVLLSRAAQVQIASRQYWQLQAIEALKRPKLIETTRGNILDRNGKILAVDKPCIDACVDYRALTSIPDADWVKEKATERLKIRLGDGWEKLSRKQKNVMRIEEMASVREDISRMWGRLAEASGRRIDVIKDARDAIVLRVQMRQRFVWYKRYKDALAKAGEKVEKTSWQKWLASGGDNATDLDSFQVTVSEQLENHVLLQAIDAQTQNKIGKDIDQYPGLTLRPGTYRTYPFNDVACHLLGHLTRVDAHDRETNKDLDDQHEYLPNDLIGKTGVESLCEPTLRGARGSVESVQGEDSILSRQAPLPGRDVRLSIDVELQQRIQSFFASARFRDSHGKILEENAVLHGAAIVLDVETNQVLAMVSYPTYDLNKIDELYPKLSSDEINEPLRNRATMSQLEPGSTIKPFCGLAAVTTGTVGVNEGIECTGAFEEKNGQLVPHGARCWVASVFGKQLRASGISVMHHLVPSDYPHRGHDGNADGFLTFSDALERSCNIYFETSADRLGIDRLSEWYEKFGLGHPTGLGIREAKGRLPRDYPKSITSMRRAMGFLGGMGQGYIAVTPIQMANAVATLARNGVWMRPILVIPDEDNRQPILRGGPWQDVPDRVNLHLLPEAIKAAKLGMYNVVNANAGTGKALVAGDKELAQLLLAGKTGTATAAPFTIAELNAAGQPVRDETGHVKRIAIAPSIMPDQPNPLAPWYRAEVSNTTHAISLDHAWYIGFAPVDKPKIAFAVMIEYGGSGGIAAASVAREAVEACRTSGYVKAPKPVEPAEEAARVDVNAQ